MAEPYTPEEVAKILRISKYTVYELVKRGDLKAYRIGNRVRIEPADLEKFIHGKKESDSSIEKPQTIYQVPLQPSNMVLRLSGSHDFLIEHMVQFLSKNAIDLSLHPTYIGSLEGMMMLHRGMADIAAIHLLDPASGEYNLPFIERIFINESIQVVHLAKRNQGFIISPGNPKRVLHWTDLKREEITFVNRQKGSGTRFLLDTHLQKYGIQPQEIQGYEKEEWNHISAAAHVANGSADVALGLETAARRLGLDFVPLAKERFDFILKRTPENEKALHSFHQTLQSKKFRDSLSHFEGYDCEEMGSIVYESN